MKFNNIVEDNNQNYLIKIPDFKVNHTQKRKLESELKYIYVPVTQELNNLLMELGWEKYKDKDVHILAPEIKVKRNRVMADSLSRGFSHFYDLSGTGEHKKFGVLRKSYITNLSVYLGGNAKLITGHSNDAVINKHYVNQKKIAQSVEGFSVFSNTSTRTQELEKLRQKSSEKSNDVEISK